MPKYQVMRVISRSEAKAKGVKRYFTGKPCKRGHISERAVSNANCLQCRVSWDRSPKGRAGFKTYRQSEKGRITNKIGGKKYRQTEKGKLVAVNCLKKHLQTEKGKATTNATAARRKAVKLQATPKWSNDERIKQIFFQAQQRTKETGIKHHVHHIIPLRELNYVSGLHCEDNLIIVTEDDHKVLHNCEEILKSLWSL